MSPEGWRHYCCCDFTALITAHVSKGHGVEWNAEMVLTLPVRLPMPCWYRLGEQGLSLAPTSLLCFFFPPPFNHYFRVSKFWVVRIFGKERLRYYAEYWWKCFGQSVYKIKLNSWLVSSPLNSIFLANAEFTKIYHFYPKLFSIFPWVCSISQMAYT